MTLRLRLVLALVALTTLGLAVFGVVTYGLYARSEYDRLDEQLRSTVPVMSTDLRQAAGLASDGGSTPSGADRGAAPPVLVPAGAYGELRAANGTVLARRQVADSTAQPAIPSDLPRPGTTFTTGSASGSGSWRVLVSTAGGPGQPAGEVVVVAVPTTSVEDSLRQLVVIEVAVAAGVLAVLAAGSWLILRAGLRPLERMARTAGTITAGALDQRVTPDDGRTEIGELGLAINTMLTDLEAAFAEREATEQRLRQFLADASHELRTPLTSIQGFAELFRLESTRAEVDLPVIMRRIEEESARMRLLVDDLLLLARLDQTRPARHDPVDLSVLAADACSDAVAVAPDREVTLHAPAPVVVRGDEDHLRQAVANLVSNAVGHTPAGTPIEVSVETVDGQARLTVRDHGRGLDPEALDHVFDRFWRADPARTGKGAGLGLAIVASITAEHGGSARAENASGGGARFTLSLPPDGGGASAPAAPSPGSDAAGG